MIKEKRKSKLSEAFWRISISAVGVALITIAVVNLLLFFFGETAAANVSTRRVGGVNGGRLVSQRYEWSLDYSFSDENGTTHNGHSTRRGSDISVRSDSRVYYFAFAPFVNTLESEAEPNLSQPLFVIVGAFLIYVMNTKKKRHNQKEQSSESELYTDDNGSEVS